MILTISLTTIDVYGIKIIKDDSTGGGCSTFGTWNTETKTCTLTSNVNEEIDILSNWITLDGNNYSINGTSVHRSESQVNSCVYLDAKIGVTITNIKILGGCIFGIQLIDSHQNIISNLQILGTTGGVGIMLHNSDDNQILNNILTNVVAGMSIGGINNQIEGNKLTGQGAIEYGGQGISIGGNNHIVKNNEISNFKRTNENSNPNGVGIILSGTKNQIINNVVKDNNYGIKVYDAQENLIESNIVSNNLFSGFFIGDSFYIVFKNIFFDNEISNNKIGIEANGKGVIENEFLENTISYNDEIGVKLGRDLPNVVRTERNVLINNNFLENTRQVSFGHGNTFNDERGGNYWSDYSSGCSNSDTNDFCDDPYPFSGGTVGVIDEAVWILRDGWSSSQSIVEQEISEPQIITESESKTKLPDWVRNIFVWYAEGQIGEDDLINALEFLINEGIIKIR